MKIKIAITRVSDGVTRSFAEDADEEGIDYQWREGNYSCDCNRRLFFVRAGGEPEPEVTGCGEGAFMVSIRDEAGNVLYADPGLPSR